MRRDDNRCSQLCSRPHHHPALDGHAERSGHDGAVRQGRHAMAGAQHGGHERASALVLAVCCPLLDSKFVEKRARALVPAPERARGSRPSCAPNSVSPATDSGGSLEFRSARGACPRRCAAQAAAAAAPPAACRPACSIGGKTAGRALTACPRVLGRASQHGSCQSVLCHCAARRGC